jgi:hypothetical protein
LPIPTGRNHRMLTQNYSEAMQDITSFNWLIANTWCSHSCVSLAKWCVCHVLQKVKSVIVILTSQCSPCLTKICPAAFVDDFQVIKNCNNSHMHSLLQGYKPKEGSQYCDVSFYATLSSTINLFSAVL